MIRPAGSTITAPTGMLPARRLSQASSNERCHAGFGQAIMGGMTQPYDETLDRLRTAYDHGAATRNNRPKQEWKIVERDAFADRIGPGARLLEIGAGTGQDSLYFQERGNSVVAVDCRRGRSRTAGTRVSTPTSWISAIWNSRRSRSTRCTP